MRRLTLLVVLVAFIFSCGGQWPVLQCIAWVNMVREYSEIVPLAKAVEMTFSGQNPCAICKAIAGKEAVGRHQSRRSALSTKRKLFSLILLLPQGRGSTVTPQIFEVTQAVSLLSRSEPPRRLHLVLLKLG